MGNRRVERKYPKVLGSEIRAAIDYYRRCGNQRKTCRRFSLTRSMFQKYLYGDHTKIPDECTQGRYPVFNKDQEDQLVSYILSIANRFYAMTRKAIGEMAFMLAERNGIQHPFKNGTASEDWVYCFLQRHQILAPRTGTPLSLARICRFTKPAVERFFDLLEEIIRAKGFNEHTIYNADETGVNLVP
ncbi:unnamed protein product, partial [Allacma fusca]